MERRGVSMAFGLIVAMGGLLGVLGRPTPDPTDDIPTPPADPELARIRAEVEAEVFRAGGPGQSLGQVGDALAVALRADGEALAADLHRRYGDILHITVGGKPYPPTPGPSTACPRFRAGDQWDDVELRLVLRTERLEAGADGSGTLTVRNRSSRRLELEAEQPLVASVVERGTDRVVGKYVGPIAGTGLLLRLGPGEQTGIRVFVGTASCETGRYAVPPGRYGVRVAFTVREGAVERRLVSPAAPLVVE